MSKTKQPIHKYTPKYIKKLRKNRRKKIDAMQGMEKQLYKTTLGELKGAGHLRINGIVWEQNVTVEKKTPPNSKPYTSRKYTIEIETKSEHGEVPMFKGYLQSGNFKDKRYKVKGWLNDEGSIRLEVTQ